MSRTINVKKWVRIARIWRYGKLTYAKKVRRWMKGQLFRDLNEIAPIMYEQYKKKYGYTQFDQL